MNNGKITPATGEWHPDKASAEAWAQKRGYEITTEFSKAQPSDKIDPAKARQILKDGEANGHPLTEAQRRMFGAAASKGKSIVRGKSEIPGDPEYWQEEAAETEHAKDVSDLHPHRQVAAKASEYFKAMAAVKNFGDVHREKALQWHKALKDLESEPSETPQEAQMDEHLEEDDVPAPGEMAEKRFDFDALDMQVEALTKRMAALNV